MASEVAAVPAVSEVEAANRLLWALNGVGTALQVISKDLAGLQGQAVKYELRFNDKGALLGAGPPYRDADFCYTNLHEPLIYAVGYCGYLPQWVDELYTFRDAAIEALSMLPARVELMLDRLTDREWTADLRLHCLDRVIVWPGETLPHGALACHRISQRPDRLLEAAAQFDPHPTWKQYREKLDACRREIVALVGRLQVSPEPQQQPATALNDVESAGNGVGEHSDPKAGADPISFQNIAELIGRDIKTVRNAATDWRKRQSKLTDPCSYALVRPFILESWPKKSILFPRDYGELRTILAAQRRD